MPAPKCCFDHILPRDLLRPVRTVADRGSHPCHRTARQDLDERLRPACALHGRLGRISRPRSGSRRVVAGGGQPHVQLRRCAGCRDPHHLRRERWCVVDHRHRRAQRAVQPGHDEPRVPRRRHRGARVRPCHRSGARALQPAGGMHGTSPRCCATWRARRTSGTRPRWSTRFFRYSLDQINGTEFDSESIMLYAFPAEWTLNGVATHANDVLSQLAGSSSQAPGVPKTRRAAGRDRAHGGWPEGREHIGKPARRTCSASPPGRKA